MGGKSRQKAGQSTAQVQQASPCLVHFELLKSDSCNGNSNFRNQASAIIDLSTQLQAAITDRIAASSRREHVCHQQLDSQAMSLAGKQVSQQTFAQPLVNLWQA